MWRRLFAAFAVATLLVVPACDGGGEEDDDNGVTQDTSVDTGDRDTGDKMDSGEEMDSSEPDDSGQDTEVADSGTDTSGDTSNPDTSPTDTSSDTTGMDTGSDSGTPDTTSDTASDTVAGDTATDTASGDTMAGDTSGGDTTSVDGDVTTLSESSIPDIRSQASGLNSGDSLPGEYLTKGVIVTAVAQSGGTVDGFFAQEPSGSVQNSAIYVFLGNRMDSGSLSPSRGDEVTIRGKVKNFFGLLEFDKVTRLQKTGTGTVPSPKVVTTSTISSASGVNDPLQSVLVELQSVKVSQTSVSSAMEVQFAVKPQGGGPEAFVFDELYTVPNVTSGKTYSSIVGPFFYSFSNGKIIPRDGNDVTP